MNVRELRGWGGRSGVRMVIFGGWLGGTMVWAECDVAVAGGVGTWMS